MNLNAHIIVDSIADAHLATAAPYPYDYPLSSFIRYTPGRPLDDSTLFIVAKGELSEDLLSVKGVTWICDALPDPETVSRSEKSGQTIIYCDRPNNTFEIVNDVRGVFLWFSEWNERLMSAIIRSNVYIPELFAIAEEYIDSFLVVVNSSGLLTHFEGEPPEDLDDSFIFDVIQRKPSTRSIAMIWRTPEAAVMGLPFVIRSTGGTYSYLVCDICECGQAHLRILVCGKGDKFTPGYQSVVMHIVSTMQMATHRLLEIGEVGTGVENYFSQLMAGSSPNRELLHFQLGRLGWNDELRYRVLVFRSVPEVENNSLKLITHLLKFEFPRTVVVRFNGGLVAVFPSETNEWAPIKLAKVVQKCMNDTRLCCGVSEVFFDIEDVRRHYLQAEFSLRFSDYGKVGFYELHFFDHFAQLAKLEELGPSIIHPAVLKLHEYDVQNGSHLVKTLCAYLETGGNKKDLAAFDYIHYNTLTYRLSRIEKICCIDLKDMKQMLPQAFHILLSCKLILSIDDADKAGQ